MRRWIALVAAAGGLAGCSGTSVHHAVLTALDARTGAQRWRVELPTASASRPVVTDGLVVVAGTNDCTTNDVTVAALDALTGRPQWTRKVPTSGGSCNGVQVLGAGSSLVITTSGTAVACPPGQSCPAPSVGVVLDARSGSVAWSVPATVQVVVAASAVGVVGVDQNGALVGLDPATGAVRWRTSAGTGSYAGTSSGGVAFVVGRPSNSAVGAVLRAVDVTNGRIDWTAQLAETGGGYPPVAGTAVVVTEVDARVAFPSAQPGVPKTEPTQPTPTQLTTVYDPASGRVLWRTTSLGDTSSTAESAGLVVIANVSRNTTVVDGYDPLSGARRWRFDLDGFVAIAATDPTSVVGTGGGLHGAITFGLDARTGREMWRNSIIGSTLVVDSGTAYIGTVGHPRHLSDE